MRTASKVVLDPYLQTKSDDETKLESPNRSISPNIRKSARTTKVESSRIEPQGYLKNRRDELQNQVKKLAEDMMKRKARKV